MCTTQTRLLFDRVTSTEAYKGLSKIQQKVVRKRNNIKAIEGNLIAAKTQGLEYWLNNSNAYYVNKLITKELFQDGEK